MKRASVVFGILLTTASAIGLFYAADIGKPVLSPEFHSTAAMTPDRLKTLWPDDLLPTGYSPAGLETEYYELDQSNFIESPVSMIVRTGRPSSNIRVYLTPSGRVIKIAIRDYRWAELSRLIAASDSKASENTPNMMQQRSAHGLIIRMAKGRLLVTAELGNAALEAPETQADVSKAVGRTVDSLPIIPDEKSNLRHNAFDADAAVARTTTFRLLAFASLLLGVSLLARAVASPPRRNGLSLSRWRVRRVATGPNVASLTKTSRRISAASTAVALSSGIGLLALVLLSTARLPRDRVTYGVIAAAALSWPHALLTLTPTKFNVRSYAQSMFSSAKRTVWTLATLLATIWALLRVSERLFVFANDRDFSTPWLGGPVVNRVLVNLIWGNAYFAFSVVLFAIGLAIGRWFSSRSRSRTYAELIKNGHQPGLVLRSFKLDSARVWTRRGLHFSLLERLTIDRHTRFEELLLNSVPGFPFAAIDRRGTPLPFRGAFRTVVPDEEDWHNHVEAMAGTAPMIAVIIDKTDGLTWEYEMISRLGLLGKTVFVVPPSLGISNVRLLSTLNSSFLGEPLVEQSSSEQAPSRRAGAEEGALVPIAAIFRNNQFEVLADRVADDIAYTSALRTAWVTITNGTEPHGDSVKKSQTSSFDPAAMTRLPNLARTGRSIGTTVPVLLTLNLLLLFPNYKFLATEFARYGLPAFARVVLNPSNLAATNVDGSEPIQQIAPNGVAFVRDDQILAITPKEPVLLTPLDDELTLIIPRQKDELLFKKVGSVDVQPSSASISLPNGCAPVRQGAYIGRTTIAICNSHLAVAIDGSNHVSDRFASGTKFRKLASSGTDLWMITANNVLQIVDEVGTVSNEIPLPPDSGSVSAIGDHICIHFPFRSEIQMFTAKGDRAVWDAPGANRISAVDKGCAFSTLNDPSITALRQDSAPLVLHTHFFDGVIGLGHVDNRLVAQGSNGDIIYLDPQD